MPEGVSLFKEIISQWNNFRLSTNQTLLSSTNSELGLGGLNSTTRLAHHGREEQVKLVNPNFIDFKPSRTRLWGEKFRLLLNKPTPYIIKDGIRFRPVGVEIL